MNELTAVCKKLRLGNLEELAVQVEFKNEIQYLTDVLKLAAKRRGAIVNSKLIHLIIESDPPLIF